MTTVAETSLPDQSLRSRLQRLPLPDGRISRFVFELLLILLAYCAYQLARGAVTGRVTEAFTNAANLIRLEKSLGIYWEAELQGLIMGHDFLVAMFNWIYVWGHLPAVGILALWIFFYRREVFARYRNAFLISGAIGLVFFITVPVAPPRFLPWAGFVDTITLRHNIYHTLQYSPFVNQFAAMPSLHLGWNLLVGLAVFQTTRVWYAKAIAALMPLLMLAAILFTANHYILDGATGVAVAVASLWLAGLLSRRFEGTRIHAVLV